jgi:hypothetical protein
MGYLKQVEIAETLPMLLHWLVGVVVGLCLVAVDDPWFTHLFDHGVLAPLLWLAGSGVVFALGSKILMFALPWPYAWVSKKLF